MTITEVFQSGLSNLQSTIENNPLASVGVAAGAGAILGAGTTAIITKSKKKATHRKKSKSYKKTKSRSRKKTYKYARTARKRKDTSHRRIRMTKSGQPYIILKSGKARFISKRSARLSRKRKGGRY